MSTVATLKESTQALQPLLLCAWTFSGQSSPSLLLATVPVTLPSNIGIMPSGFYDGRIAAQDIEALQNRSQQGIDRAAKAQVHIFDADRFVWDNYVLDHTTGTPKYGFRGATIQVALIMWQPGTSTFSSDAPVVFVGTCDMEVPQHGGDVLLVSANSSHDMQTVKLPDVPIQSRCPWVFPPSTANHSDALFNPASPYYECGYSASVAGGVGNRATTGGPANDGKSIVDQFGTQVTDSNGYYLYCDYTRNSSFLDQQGHTCPGGCMARLGNSATTSVAPDGDLMHDQSGNRTGRAGFVEWSPGTYYAIVKNYTSNSKIPAFSFINQAVLGQYQNLLYGTQFVNPKIANVLESGNDTLMECMICFGDIGAFGVGASTSQGVYISVVVNGVQVAQTPTGDPNLWWSFANATDGHGAYTSTGGRNGICTFIAKTQFSPSGSQALGDPYGSIARIVIDVYKDVFTGFGVPTVQILAHGPQIWVYAPIASVTSGSGSLVITWPSNYINYYFSGPAQIFGTSSSALNGASLGVYTSQTSGGGFTLTTTFPCSATGSGTGGWIGQLTYSVNSNSAWVTLDLLIKSNWALAEINLTTFQMCAFFCDTVIEYVNNTGQIATHPRYKSQFSLEQRRSAGEVLAAVLRSFNGYLYTDQAGLLCLGINRTLADEQPTAITGSNYNTPVNSTTAQFKGVWVASYTYTTGDMVTYSGGYYTSSTDGNTGNNPSGGAPWTSATQPQGYVAYLFNETNIARNGSGDTEYFDIEGEANATILTPNQIFIQFQDEDNSYVVDSLGQIDAASVTRAGGALQPGGSLIPETLTCLGIPNMDQAIRIANTYIAERQYGNLASDPRGTTVFTFGTTVKAEHLRTGHLVAMTLQTFGYSMQLFRVLKIQPSTNYSVARITVQFHNDIWYTDTYQQAPLTKASNVASNRPGRAPLPWQPYGEQPQPAATSPLWSSTEWNFQVAEIDGTDAAGNPAISLQISGNPPVNQISGSVQPPIVPSFGTVTTGGIGTLSGPLTVMVQLCALDGSGNYSAPSAIVTTYIPSGVVGAAVQINNVGWLTGSVGYDLFVGNDHFNITHQSSNGASTPTSFTINSIPNAITYGPPDLAAYSMYVQGKPVIHGGIIGETVVATDSTHITIGAPSSGTLSNNLVGYKILLIGRPNQSAITNIPIIDFTIKSGPGFTHGYVVNVDGSVKFLVDRNPTSLIDIYDVVVVCTQGNINSTTTIGDSNFVNAYTGSGIPSFEGNAGYLVRIISGTGRYQIRSIVGTASGTTYTVSPAWTVQPDATSYFIVESHSWPYASDTTQIANASYTDQPIAIVPFGNYAKQVVLVQPIIYDPSGNLASSQYRSPVRMLWLNGTQGTRTIDITTTGGMYNTDRTLLFNTTGVTQPTPTTLNGAINTTQQNVTLTANYTAPNGTVMQVDTGGSSELMYVQSGSGSTAINVIRNWPLGGTGLTHSNLAPVTIPGGMTWTIVPFSEVPNQRFAFSKISTDINYVQIYPNGSDPSGATNQLPDGEAYHILADTSTAYGTYVLDVPQP